MSSREKSPVGENTRTACRTLNHVPRARTRDHAAGGCFDLCSGVCVCVCVCVCACVRDLRSQGQALGAWPKPESPMPTEDIIR